MTEFPTPKNLRFWFGLLNQVAYAFSMAKRMPPFRDLLKPATPFHWDDSLDQVLILRNPKLQLLMRLPMG